MAATPGHGWDGSSGFKKLGFDVCFIEQIGRDACRDSVGAMSPFKSSVNLAYFQATMARFGLSQSSALIYRNGEEVHGLDSINLPPWRKKHVCSLT